MIFFSIQFTCMGILETFLLKDTARLSFFKMCTLPRPHLGFHIKVQILLLLFGKSIFLPPFSCLLIFSKSCFREQTNKKTSPQPKHTTQTFTELIHSNPPQCFDSLATKPKGSMPVWAPSLFPTPWCAQSCYWYRAKPWEVSVEGICSNYS